MKRLLLLLWIFSTSLLAVTVTVNKIEYSSLEPIKVTLKSMPGNAHDWVGVYPKGATNEWKNILVWKHDGKVQNGTYTLDGLEKAGEYEARVFQDNSYIVLATTTFKVKNLVNNTTIETSLTKYKSGNPITVTVENMPGNEGDWIGVFAKGKPSIWENVLTWKFDGKVVDGTYILDGLEKAGEYEARVFLNNSYKVLATASFSVVDEVFNTTVTTNSEAYLGDNISVTLSGMPGNSGDWVGIFKKGDPDVWEKCIAWKFDGKVKDGTYDLDSVPIGEYEVRIFLNNSMKRLAKAGFKVVVKPLNTKVNTDKLSYENGETITVSVEDMLGNQKDWVGIFAVGAVSKFENAYDWVWTEAIKEGELTFHGLPAGEYEVRAFFNNSFEVKSTNKFKVTKVNKPPTVYENAENNLNPKWEQILGKYPPKRITPGFQSSGTLLLTPEWKETNGDWENGAEYHLPLGFSIQKFLDIDIGGMKDYKLKNLKKGYMPHYSLGVYVKTLKGDRVMIWDSYFNHEHVEAHIADYGNGNIWLQYPSPVEHVRGWFGYSVDLWEHFRVDIEAELKKLEPDNRLIHVKKLLATGGFLDNIKLSSK